jgi:hypothetical protein
MGDSPSAGLTDQCIQRGLEPLLMADGYVKRSRTYFKALEHCVLMVNIQGSQWNSSAGARFTLNLAVHFPDGDRQISRRLPSPLPKLHKTPMQVRLGLLMPGNRDHWWELSGPSEVENVAAQVLNAWKSFGRVWLEKASEP